MSKKAEQIKARYLNGYVTDAQLVRYLELGAITEAEYKEIYEAKYGAPEVLDEPTEPQEATE